MALSSLSKTLAKKCGAAVILLIVWQALSVALPIQYRGLVIAGPLASFKTLCAMALTGNFRQCIFSSSLRVWLGLLYACMTAIVTAVTCLKFPWTEIFVAPFVSLMKSLPVVVIVVLLLILFSSTGIALAVVFLVTFPILHTAFFTGFRASDPKLLEMANVFGWTGLHGLVKRWRWIRLPAARNYLENALRVAAGMSWKAGIAAEVIGAPVNSIGWALYGAKITLSTEELFAWAAVILLLGFFTEQLALALLRFVYFLSSRVWFQFRIKEPSSGARAFHELHETHETAGPEIKICHLSKSFSGTNGESERVTVFRDLNLIFPAGKITALMGESGVGKTTLLHMILGLESPDNGEIDGIPVACTGRCAALFQEDRLINHLSAIDNILITYSKAPSRGEVMNCLHAVGLNENLNAPVHDLSGGMARRVALVRALMAPSDVILLDEPLSGLDTENVQRVISFIKTRQRGRTVIAIVHEREHAVALGDCVVELTREI